MHGKSLFSQIRASARASRALQCGAGSPGPLRFLRRHELARIAPMGMIFVPSRAGVSHSPREYTSPADVANGANVLEVTGELTRVGASQSYAFRCQDGRLVVAAGDAALGLVLGQGQLVLAEAGSNVTPSVVVLKVTALSKVGSPEASQTWRIRGCVVEPPTTVWRSPNLREPPFGTPELAALASEILPGVSERARSSTSPDRSPR